VTRFLSLELQALSSMLIICIRQRSVVVSYGTRRSTVPK